jgi:PAS domain S-box-containing protein
MSVPLHILFVEDRAEDIELESAALEEAGYSCTWDQVETLDRYLACLKEPTYDLIITDYSLPTFDGLTAVNLFHQFVLDIPLIIVSGTMGEERAIEALKAGATDYVLKTRLSRLAPVVRRALQEKEAQRHRHKAEAAQREAEMRYRDLFENANDIIYTHDLRGNFSSINKMGERVTGYDREEILGTNIARLVAPGYAALASENISRKLAGDMDSATYEIEIICKDGKSLPLEVSTRLIYEGNDPVGVQGIARDISDRRRAESEHQQLEEQLLQAQKMESIGRLAGGIAHDFNNLLTAIIGYGQLLLNRFGSDDSMRRETEEIIKAGQRAAGLTGQLLAFSRRQRLERKTININDTVGGLLKMLRRIIGEDIDIVVQAGQDLAPVFADPGQVEQVLLNLAVNARDAMPDGGQMIISTDGMKIDEEFCRENVWARQGDYLRIAVQDTGEGMDEETLQRIFEPFFTTKEVGKGTGLGLAVAYGVVQQHEGLIHVRSRKGQGTTFEIYLPVKEADKEAEAEEPSAFLRGGAETILVAEDELTLRGLIAEILTGLGYHVIVAGDGQEAVRLFEARREEIALVILDLVMPKMGGREAYAELVARGSDVPVLFMTGYSSEVTREARVQDIEGSLIQKPYSVGELGRKVREVLDRKKG